MASNATLTCRDHSFSQSLINLAHLFVYLLLSHPLSHYRTTNFLAYIFFLAAHDDHGAQTV